MAEVSNLLLCDFIDCVDNMIDFTETTLSSYEISISFATLSEFGLYCVRLPSTLSEFRFALIMHGYPALCASLVCTVHG